MRRRPSFLSELWVAVCLTSPLWLLVFCLMVIMSSSAQAFEVCWEDPTENVDGSPLTDLVIIRVYWGSGSRAYDGMQDVQVDAPGYDSCTEINAAPGEYFVSGTAVDSDGNESAYSNEVGKTEINTDPLPPVMIATERTAYTVIKRPDAFVLLPIGTVPAGTQCDPNNMVNGHSAVPFAAVSWSPGSTARPVVVVALCDG